MECRALVGSWCQSASAQLSVSPAALQAVEAAAAELAPESPPGHLDRMFQQHGSICSLLEPKPAQSIQKRCRVEAQIC